MTATLALTADQLSTPEVIADPYPYFHVLCDQSPLNYRFLPAGAVWGFDELIRAWALMRHDDVYNALRGHDTFSSRHCLVGKIGPPLALINDDPPRHTRFRRLVNKTFTLKRIEALTPWMEHVVDDLVGEIGTRETDIIESFAIPMPLKVIARLLGIPGEEYLTFKRWSETFFAFDSMTPEQRAKSNQEMMTYFGLMAAKRRAHGAEDLITALVEAEIEGESLNDAEILDFCMLLLIAGNEKTANLIGNMLGILADRPELWRQLREDRSLVNTVIDETLRYESPFQRLSRQTTRKVYLSDIRIPQDSRRSARMPRSEERGGMAARSEAEVDSLLVYKSPAWKGGVLYSDCIPGSLPNSHTRGCPGYATIIKPRRVWLSRITVGTGHRAMSNQDRLFAILRTIRWLSPGLWPHRYRRVGSTACASVPDVERGSS